MKSFIFIPFALLLGMLIGSWSPKSEIKRLKTQLASTRELLKEQPKRERTINEVTSLLGIERSAKRSRTKSSGSSNAAGQENKNQPDEAAEKKIVSVIETNSAGDTVTNKISEVAKDESPENMKSEIDKAAELWQMRVNIARSTFISNAGLNDQQSMQFDLLLDGMNLKIGETIDNFAENIDEAEEVQMEAGIRVMNDITDSIVETYDEMDKSMPEGWRRSSGDKFSLVNFIDPEVGRPLVGLEGKLEQLDGGRNRN